jgi:hypothetical protein
LHFFVKRLQRSLLQREFKEALSRDPEFDAEDIDDFAFQKLREKAREEVKINLSRLIYRNRYNIPPNDPRFLDLTDEEIVYELVLQSEYTRWADHRYEEEEADDSKVIYRNTDEYESMAKKLERGEDIDLESLMTPDEDWEKLDG